MALKAGMQNPVNGAMGLQPPGNVERVLGHTLDPKIEGLYGMFEKATQAIERNKGALLDKYIGDALVEAFD